MAEHARKIRRAVILAALVVVVVGGFLVGRAGVGLVTGHGDKRPPAKARVSQPAVAAQVASRPVAGARRGFRLGRSRDGAAAAAGIFATRIVGFALAGHLAREGEYGRITTSRARASLLALADSSEQVVRGNLSGGPGPVTLRMMPLGYRVVSYTPSRAVVDLWTVGIGGGRLRPPTASFGSTLVTLEWQRGGWRLDAFQNVAGLTPAVAPVKANPAEVLADQDKYRVYGILAP